MADDFSLSPLTIGGGGFQNGDGVSTPTSLDGSFASGAATSTGGGATSSGWQSYLGAFTQIANTGVTAYQGYNAAHAQAAQAKANNKASKFQQSLASNALQGQAQTKQLLIISAVILVVGIVLLKVFRK